jgi:hypothetical protein
VRRTRLLIALVLLAASAVPAWVLARLGMHPHFTESMAARVHEGMTEAEVVAVIGMPPGDYASRDDLVFEDLRAGACLLRPRGSYSLGRKFVDWIDDDGCVVANFDPAGREVDCYWWPTDHLDPPPPSLWDSFRRSLGGRSRQAEHPAGGAAWAAGCPAGRPAESMALVRSGLGGRAGREEERRTWWDGSRSFSSACCWRGVLS